MRERAQELGGALTVTGGPAGGTAVICRVPRVRLLRTPRNEWPPDGCHYDIRVVIVDDHAIFREGLRAVLDGREGIEVVADHGDAESALNAVDADSPDVVLMDLHLPGIGGVAATRQLSVSHPQVRVLVLSMLDDGPTVLAALAAGARDT